MESELLKKMVVTTLEDMKGQDIACLEVRDLTSIADYMVVVTGTSNRQVKALTDAVVKNAKQAGIKVRGVEGDSLAEWSLIDLGDVIVHVMQAATRKLYDLESLWSMGASREA